MEVYRTPDECFADVPDWPHEPHYVDVDAGDGSPALRMAYVDAGPSDGPTVLMLHGEPTWSFLYRKVISVVTAAGCRAVAPDLIGFGRSDKPLERADYTYTRHTAWLTSFMDVAGLGEVTLLCQDWGGLLGLRLVGARPERFARVVAANTSLPTGDRPLGEAFLAWREYSQTAPELPIGRIVTTGCVEPMPDAVVAAYDAPFPEERAKAGARQFPALAPESPDDVAAAANRAAWDALARYEKPFLTAFSDGDPVTRGGDRPMRKLIPGAHGREHPVVLGAGHFLQEDRGEELGEIVVRFVRETT